MFRKSLVATFLALTVLALSSSACGSRQRSGMNVGTSSAFPPRTVILPGTQDAGYVRAVVAQSLSERGYVVEQESPGSIIANVRQRGALLRLAVNYSNSQVVLYHVESQGLQMNRDGTSRTYDNWTSNLEASIRRNFGRVAPAAAPTTINVVVQ